MKKPSQIMFLSVLLAALWLMGPNAARAAEPTTLNISAQPLGDALNELARQTGLQIVLYSKIGEGVLAPELKGRFTADEALHRLLQNTKLTYKFLDARTVSVTSAPAATLSSPIANRTGDPVRLSQADVPDASTQANQGAQRDSSDQPPNAQVNIPEILVKGSRIMNVDVVRTEDDAQPYTILDSKMIEKSGATSVEDFLKQELTMNTTAQTNSQSAPSIFGATSLINLRGLGSNETLILINGRRSAGISINGSINQTDINGIPLSAIERIEVLPSSASAIYGGAAVGGVVNIVLKKNFDGGSAGYTYDSPFSGRAPLQNVNASYGFSLGEGHTQVMLAASYADGSPLLLADRQQLVGRGVSTILANSPSFLYSPFNPFPGATTNIASLDGSNLILKSGSALGSPITFVSAGTAPGASLASGLLANAGRYNLALSPGTGLFGLGSGFTVPTTKSILGTLRQRIFEDIELFSEFSTSSNSSRISNSPFNNPYVVPASAPTDPFQQDVLVTFPSTLASPETTDSVTHSVTVGMVVPFSYGWSSELDFTWSKNAFEYALNVADNTALGAALSTGTVDPFVDAVKYPLALGRYLAPATFSGDSTLNDLGFRASGPIGTLPAGRPTLTIGLEHRREGSHDSDGAQNYPLTPTSSLQEIFFGQSQSTNSIYAEGLVPLIAPDNHVPAVHALDLQIAGRSERYTVFTQTPYEYLPLSVYQAFNPPQGIHATIHYTSTNPTVALKYQPLADVTLRASYSTAFLPPTASQLLANFTPVCGASPCTLIVDPRNGQSYEINYTTGGNPALKPQRSRDWDLGLIWEPREGALQGLRMDGEYYNITQPNYITSPTPQQVASDPAFIDRVTRDSTGRITSVDTSPVNAAEYKTSGWDFKTDYRKSTAWGTIGIRAAGTLTSHDQRQYAIGSPFLNYVGFPGDGGEGKIKANATLSWEYRHLTLAWTTTYYSSYKQAFSPGSPSAYQYGVNPIYTDAQGGFMIPSQTYHEIFGSYAFEPAHTGMNRVADAALSDWTVKFGIKNLFDKLPPFDAFYGPYYYSPYGDARLRDYRISISKYF